MDPSFTEALSVLNEMQREGMIGRCAVGGAVAAYLYIEPRATADIDIFMALEGDSLDPLGPIFARLKELGHSEFRHEGLLIGGWVVQFVPVFKPLEVDALKSAVLLNVDTVPFLVFRPEHLMALCLDLGRPKDDARLSEFLAAKAFDPAPFERLIEQFQLSGKLKAFKCRMNL